MSLLVKQSTRIIKSGGDPEFGSSALLMIQAHHEDEEETLIGSRNAVLILATSSAISGSSKVTESPSFAHPEHEFCAYALCQNGFQRAGKHANFQNTCKALLATLEAEKPGLVVEQRPK